MKEALFYTFLTLFVLTFVVTIAGALKKNLMEKWVLKLLLSVFVVELGVAVLGLFKATDFFTPDKIRFKPNDTAIEVKFTPKDWLSIGHYSVTKNRSVEAIKAYKKYMKNDKNAFEAWYGIGIAYLNAEDWENGYRAFKNAYESRDESVAHMNAGICAKNQNKTDVAIREFEKSLNINPDIAKIWYNYGNLYFDNNKFAEAVEKYEVAIQRNSQYGNAWHNLTICYYELSNRTEFLRSLDSAVRLNPALKSVFNEKFTKYTNDEEFQRLTR